MYNELLIKALRWCADESICCDDFSGEKCPYFDEKKGSCSADEILHAAADALEADEQRIAKLEKAQLPKEGEWIPNSPFTGNCSECGGDGNLKDKYCPNCGRRMRKIGATCKAGRIVTILRRANDEH